MKLSRLALAISFVTAPAFAAEAEKDAEKWDVAAPPMETREVAIKVDEGTWMNVDVSPDGRTIAFDLLGDIYTMPITGGAATRIADGLPFEMQPRFSPDGNRIAFTSDRGGGDNIWVMNADGSNKKAVTTETFRLMNSPAWSPDGRFLAARKHYTTGRSLGTGEIWMYHLGGGDGVALVKKPNENFQKELGEPVYSSDGKSIYYTRNTTSGGTFDYAQDSNAQVFAIERYDLATGERHDVVTGAGGAVRSQPSPDGSKIAFVRRDRGQSKLYVKDMASGKINELYGALDMDMQETWGVHGLYPTMDWTPDGRTIVFWAGGKIRRVDMAGNASVIPFSVNDTRKVIDAPRPPVSVFESEFTTTMPRFASVSPDGRRVVFETLGKLYVKSLPNGAPRRLTNNAGDDRELFPSWSRDGRRIVFVRWNDETLGSINTVSASGGGARKITSEPGHYRRPAFSPDGRAIAFEKGEGGYLTSLDWSENAGVYVMPAGGGAMRLVTDSGGNPHFGADNERLFVNRGGESQSLVSINLNGEAARTHATSDLGYDFMVSPDGRHIAFRQNYSVYVTVLPPGPQEVSLSKSSGALPVVQASAGGSAYHGWSNATTVFWSLGPEVFSTTTTALNPANYAEGESYEAPTSGASLAIKANADKPSGVVALTGARIITMTADDGGVIDNGVIVIDGNRIAAVGAAGSITIPTGARTIDLVGATITPGFIDAHAHGAQGVDDLIPQKNWAAISHLALGVTTIHDPSNVASQIFAAAELQRTGGLLAPRIFSTGEIVYGAKAAGYYAEIDKYEDALAHVRRLKAQGAHSIKNYNQPRRDQRQMVVKAAKEENLAVVAEGGSLFTMDMTLVADGNTTLEHNLPQAALYEDVLSFYGQTNVGYTPTLTVTYGGLGGDPYWRYKTDVWTHPILSKHAPRHILEPSSVRRTKAPEEDFADTKSAKTAKALADRGVMVSIGAHGQQQGLAAHWEMWSFAKGGMSPVEVLRTATSTPAKALGYDRDIGTLEPGKLADLVVMTDNPLDDIRNTDKISHVMLNGRLYDAATMNEVGGKARAKYYWE